jgi:SAM-dependent methyltransferase
VEALEIALEHNEKDSRLWSYLDNREFYEKISLHGFIELLRLSGLTANQDVALISGYIMKAKSILDIGGGFGRVINACQQLGYNGDLSVIEYTHSYAEFLRNNLNHCEVIEDDFLTYGFTKKFDLLLMMWTTISIFTPAEQKLCFKKCAKLLNRGGYCVIDLLIANTCDEAKANKSKEYSFVDQETGIEHHGYVPTTFEIIRAAARAKLGVREIREYTASTARRCLVILGQS